MHSYKRGKPDGFEEPEEELTFELKVEIITGGGLYVRGQLEPGSMTASKIAAAVLNIRGVQLNKKGLFEAYLPCLSKSCSEEKRRKKEAFRRLLSQRSGVEIIMPF